MCFSATASFAAAALLAVVGATTWRMARHRAERPLAAIPLLFAAQQLSEGWLWLGFRADWMLGTTVLAQVYAFFSHVLWPVHVPLAAWLVEPPGRGRRRLGAAAAAASLFGAYMFYTLFADPITASVNGLHIRYDARHENAPFVAMLYLASTAGALAMSSHVFVRLFGLLAFASFVLSYVFYAQWFISVWCFFAALLSAVVYLHFASRARVPGAKAAWMNAAAR